MIAVIVIWMNEIGTLMGFVWYLSAYELNWHPANEGRRYFVSTSLIGWAQA